MPADVLAEESEGKASRDGEDVTVALTRPDEKKFDCSRTRSSSRPSRWSGSSTSALDGDTFVSFEVYDGSESGETVFDDRRR